MRGGFSRHHAGSRPECLLLDDWSKDATVLPEENGPWNRNRGDVPEPSPSCDAGGSGNEAGETRQPEPTVGNIPSSLHRLAALDTNIAALVGWGWFRISKGGAGSCRAGVSGRRKPGRGDPLARPEEQQRRTAE